MKEPDLAAIRSGVSLTNCDGETSVGLADQQPLVVDRRDTDSGPKQQAPSVVQWSERIARIGEAVNRSTIDRIVESDRLAPTARQTNPKLDLNPLSHRQRTQPLQHCSETQRQSPHTSRPSASDRQLSRTIDELFRRKGKSRPATHHRSRNRES